MDSHLFIIGTPIGNLEDLTLRARRVLTELTHFMAEDTRESRRLLELSAIPLHGKQFYSYALHNMKAATETALEILRSGQSVGLMSDRGTPAVSDPGALLVAGALAEGIRVVPIPGVSSVTTALSVCGHDASQFLFLGFVPTQATARKSFVEAILQSPRVVCFFEAPHRIRETLRILKEAAPSASLFIARELTKQFESLTYVKISEIDPEKVPELGEFTLVFSQEVPSMTTPSALEDWIRLRLTSDKEWAKEAGKSLDIAANEAYNALQKSRQKPI